MLVGGHIISVSRFDHNVWMGYSKIVLGGSTKSGVVTTLPGREAHVVCRQLCTVKIKNNKSRKMTNFLEQPRLESTVEVLAIHKAKVHMYTHASR